MTLADKLKILELLQKGEKIIQVAAKFNIN